MAVRCSRFPRVLACAVRVARRCAREERAYTLIEMVAVAAILSVVVGGLTTLFAQGANAEVEMNRRVQAQLQARLALDHLRREVHCAEAITPSGTAAAITLTLPVGCPTGSGTVSWCTVNRGPSRYGLYRLPGSTCDATGRLHADYLTAATVFSYTPQSSLSLAKLRVDFPVSVEPGRSGSYRLADDIVLRNSTRS